MNRTLRIRFAKFGKIRFTSHRDVARICERALRRAELPVAYSEGFAPRPRLSFGLALPTGYESLGEYLDVDLVDLPGDLRCAGSSGFDAAAFLARLDPCLPLGFRGQAAAVIEPGTPSLQQSVVSCTWRFTVTGAGADQLRQGVRSALVATALPATRIRKGREVDVDLRAAILSLAVIGPSPEGVELECELTSQPSSVRPSELLPVLGDGLSERRACRVHQWMLRDGARQEPLPLPDGATSAPHAEARAS
jgi:radical SAM-linked protein